MSEIKVSHVEAENIVLDFKDGFAMTEVLEGTFQKGDIRVYRCALKAGACVKPEMKKDTLQVLFLTSGLGAVVTPAGSFAVDEASVFVPDPDSEYTVCASTDMVYTVFVVGQEPRDIIMYNDVQHLTVPLFRPISKCWEYTQDSCKTKNSVSRSIIPGFWLSRVMAGACEFSGDKEGTYEKPHRGCEQWNMVYGKDSEVTIDVEGEKFVHKDGDISYIPGGLAHNLYADGDVSGKYVWFEYMIPEEGSMEYPKNPE